MTRTAHQSRYLRDYADRAAKMVTRRRPFEIHADHRHRARNRLIIAVILFALSAAAGYFWGML